MALNTTQAIEILQSPRSKAKISEAKRQESQLRVFTENLSKEEISNESYWTEFQHTIKKRMPTKFDRLEDFVRFPLPVVQLSDSILNDYYKVFEGKNRFFNVTGDRDLDRLKNWIKESDLENWIEKHAREVFKNKPNSYVAIDVDDNSKPYLVYIDSNRLIDLAFKSNKIDLEYIAFIHSQKVSETNNKVIVTSYSVYTEEHYYVFTKDSDKDDYVLQSESVHNLGCCPARPFLSTTTNDKNLFKRRVAFSSALSMMEDWSLFDVYNNYVCHYAPFPVTEAPAKSCQNQECTSGKVKEEVVVNHATGETKDVWSTCPVCKGGDKGKHIGPGTHIGIKVSADKDIRDGSGIFKIITPDTDKLKFVPEKLENLELQIKLKTTGVNTLTENEAFNEMQVKGSFTSMESVLLRTKTELDLLYKWIVSTTAKLFYKQINVNVEANFGTEFYLVTEDNLQKRYDNAKKIGLPLSEQLNIYKELISTKYKGNKVKISREEMLLDLDPFPMYSIEECIVLKKESVLDDFQLSLKVNFLKFVSQFEHENISITDFGINLEYSQRIELIEKMLLLYNQELIDEKNVRTNPNAADGERQVSQEQLEAQARLKGTVGGVQGIIGLLESKANNIITLDSAIQTMIEIYGFDEETAKKILGTDKTNVNGPGGEIQL